MALRFKPPEEKNEAQELLRQEQGRAAPQVGPRGPAAAGAGGAAAAARVREVRIYLIKDAKAQPVETQSTSPTGLKARWSPGRSRKTIR